jgi:hypothetical protein
MMIRLFNLHFEQEHKQGQNGVAAGTQTRAKSNARKAGQ